MSLITISGYMGCGVREIAQNVAKGLNLDIYDDQELLELAPKVGVLSEDLKALGNPGFFSRLFHNKPQVYMDYMDAIIYEISRRGEGIIIGHGSQILLQDFGCALHVRINAPEAARLETIREQQELDVDVARKLLQATDSKQRKFCRLAFDMDFDNPDLYDLILNSAKIGYKTIATLVMDTARAEEMAACSLTALEAMERLSILKRIQGALLKNDLDDRLLTIDIVERGIVQVNGLSNDSESVNRIIKTIEGVQGVQKVHSGLMISPPLY
ncbi:MAG: cytidylate kinase family protein [Desulfatiglandaceae bacterium]